MIRMQDEPVDDEEATAEEDGLPEGVMTPEELENMGIKLGNVEAPEDRDEL